VDLLIADDVYPSEFQYHGTHAHGLGFAYLIEAIALSLCSEVQWDASHIEIEATRLGDDEHIFTEQVMVVHASRVDHVQEHIIWIQNRLRTSVRDGVDLWDRRKACLLPYAFVMPSTTKYRVCTLETRYCGLQYGDCWNLSTTAEVG
jgi:hypothetical protein